MNDEQKMIKLIVRNIREIEERLYDIEVKLGMREKVKEE